MSSEQSTSIERTGARLPFDRWRVVYRADEGMDTETTHLTRWGAELSRWLRGSR